MTTAPPVKKKENTIVKAIGDLVILALLLAGAGFGGYFWGTHQQLAPVLKVGLGTPGTFTPTAAAAGSSTTSPDAPAAHKKHKYWLSSSGTDWIGYSIVTKVNDTAVDSFFGPGKIVDVTSLVKPGQNTIEFEAKQLGSEYNHHAGDAGSTLTLQLVSGSSISDSFKPSDVLLGFKRNAAQTDGANETMHFNGE